MVYYAQNYYGAAEDVFDPSKISGLDAAVMNFRSSLNSASSNSLPPTASATSVGTQSNLGSFGRDSFDAVQYGRDKDGILDEKPSPDAVRETELADKQGDIGVSDARIQELLNAGIPLSAIKEAEGVLATMSTAEAAANYRETGYIDPQDAQAREDTTQALGAMFGGLVGGAVMAGAASAGGSSTDSYTQDADLELAAEQAKAPSQEAMNMAAYQALLREGFTHKEIYDAQTAYGLSNEDMLLNARTSEKHELVPEHQQAALQALAANEEYAKEFAKSMETPKQDMAKDGPHAVWEGGRSATDLAVVGGSELFRA